MRAEFGEAEQRDRGVPFDRYHHRPSLVLYGCDAHEATALLGSWNGSLVRCWIVPDPARRRGADGRHARRLPVGRNYWIAKRTNTKPKLAYSLGICL